MNSPSVSTVDYRRGKSLRQNLGRSPGTVALTMPSQLSNLTGQGSAGTPRAYFRGGRGAHESHRCSWNILDECEKELELSSARLQDKVDGNEGTP